MTRHFLKLAALAGAMSLGQAPNAFAEALDSAELRKRIIGRTIYLKVPLGGEFPLIYRRDGTVSGDGTSVGLGRFFASKETGKWQIAGNQLCQQFPTWYKGERMCFTVVQTGAEQVRWTRDNGQTGEARIGD